MEMLLQMGGDPNRRDSNGCTPLTFACMREAWSICSLLMGAGADLSIPFNCPGGSGSGSISGSSGSGSGSGGSMKEVKKWRRPHDLLTSTAVRKMLYARISAPQTVIPLEQRDRCMHCALSFVGNDQDGDGGGDVGDDGDDADRENVEKSAKTPNNNATSLTSMMASSFLSSFTSSSLSSASFSLSSSSADEKVPAKSHCSLCVRVLCETCASYRVPRPMMPVFLQEQFSTTKIFTVCAICYAILKEKKSNISRSRSAAKNHLGPLIANSYTVIDDNHCHPIPAPRDNHIQI